MFKKATALRAVTVTCALLLTAACGDDDETTMERNPRENTGGSTDKPEPSSGGSTDKPEPSSGGSTGNPDPGSDQLPPHGHDAIITWLEDRAYAGWACESEIHEARSPSPHGFNRICANDVLADDASGTGNWRKGAAAVKELYASADATAPIGYAVYEKTQDDSAGGMNWYWYEIVPADHPAPHDSRGVVADGLATDEGGPEFQICVGCHMAAGEDAAHTPSVGGRDQVYTPVGR